MLTDVSTCRWKWWRPRQKPLSRATWRSWRFAFRGKRSQMFARPRNRFQLSRVVFERSRFTGRPDEPKGEKGFRRRRERVYSTPSGADASVVSWRTRRPRCMSVRVPAKLSDSRRSSRTRRASHLQLPLSSPRRAGGLDEQVTDAVLHAAFVPFGEVKEVNIPLEQTTQKNRGFAFVTFVETCVRGRPTTRTRSRRARSRPRDEPASLLRATRSGLTVSFAKSFPSTKT